jgi:hypothetical protein
MFSRVRDPYPSGPHDRSGNLERPAPFAAVARSLPQGQGLREEHADVLQHETNQLEEGPKWAFANDYRRYPAIGVSPDHEFPFGFSSGQVAQTQPSNRPDLGTAGPQGDPGDEEDEDDESWTEDRFEVFITGAHHAKAPFEANRPGKETEDDWFDHDRVKEDWVDHNLVDHNLVDDDGVDDDDDDDDDGVDDDGVDGNDHWVDDDQIEDESLKNVLVIDQWAEAPFSCTSGIAPWPIDTPDDAFDTMELHRSRTLQTGLVILALDHHRVPFLHVSLRGNPVDDIQRALSLFCPALPNGQIPSGLILGVIRSQHREAPESVLNSLTPITKPSIWVDPIESAAWRVAAWNLHDEGIKLHDVMVIEPDRWMSLARAAGLVTYDTVQDA